MLAAIALAAIGGRASSQPRAGTPRVGMLSPSSPTPDGTIVRLVAALRERGRIDGATVQVVARHADGELDRLAGLARDLVAARADVVVAVGASATRAAFDASPTVPVVFFGNFDPVATGLVPSLARPGGRATGVLISSDGTLSAKRLELLRDAVPGANRIAVLAPDDPGAALQLEEIAKAGVAAGVATPVVVARDRDYERAFREIVATRPAALFVAAHTFFVRDRQRIIALANRHRLPAIYEWPEQADDGGLMAYGANLALMYRRIAEYVDRILGGTRAGDLPVIQPSTYELVVNLEAARTIGHTMPASLLQRADRVVR